MWTLDFGRIDVGFWLFGRLILFEWTLEFRFLFDGCWILIVWTLNFGCLDIGFWLGRC